MVHLGETDAAISAISASPYSAAESPSTIYTPAHADLILGYALATRGRAAEALHVLGRASQEATRRGLSRYTANSLNTDTRAMSSVPGSAMSWRGSGPSKQATASSRSTPRSTHVTTTSKRGRSRRR